MTDTFNNNGNNDETEDLSQLDTSEVNLEEYGVIAQPSVDSLANMMRIYNLQATEIIRLSEARKSGEVKDDFATAVVKAWGEAEADHHFADASKEVFETLEKDPTLVVALLAQVESLKSDLLNFKNYAVNKEVNAIKQEKGVKSTTDEEIQKLKKVCAAIREMIDIMIPATRIMQKEKFEAFMPTLYKKDAKRNLLNLTDLPKGPRTGNAVGYDTRKVQFVYDGEALPLGLSVDELCFEYLSTSTFRFSREKLDTLLAASSTTKTITGGTVDKPWSLVVNGKELIGWMTS